MFPFISIDGNNYCVCVCVCVVVVVVLSNFETFIMLIYARRASHTYAQEDKATQISHECNPVFKEQKISSDKGMSEVKKKIYRKSGWKDCQSNDDNALFHHHIVEPAFHPALTLKLNYKAFRSESLTGWEGGNA